MVDKAEPQKVKGRVVRAESSPVPERRSAADHEAYFNAQFDAQPVYIEPGTVKFGQNVDEMLVGTVGTGVLLSLYDQQLKFGALGYVVLPESVLDCFPFLDKADQQLVHKAFEPIDKCIGEMKKRGAGKMRIRIRLYGGLIREDDPDDRGIKNTVFVQEYLFRKGLPVFNADIGGPLIRRVHFFPTTGRAVRRLLKRDSDFYDIQTMEEEYNKIITSSD